MMCPEINPEAVHRTFKRSRFEYKITYSSGVEYDMEPVASGYALAHVFQKAYTVICCHKIHRHSTAECLLCSLKEPRKQIPFEVYYVPGKDEIILNRTRTPQSKYCELANILAMYVPQYKNPHTPNIFNVYDGYPAHVMPRLNRLYADTLAYSNKTVMAMLVDARKKHKLNTEEGD